MAEEDHGTPQEFQIDELKFLQDHGEDVSGLQADLETVLKDVQRKEEPAPAQEIKPEDDNWLPISPDGEILKTRPRQDPQPKADEQTQQITRQPDPDKDAALDPYAPDGQRSRNDGRDGQENQDGQDSQDEGEPGEVVVDSEGKVRDAKTGRYVPHQALHAERVRNKEMRSEMEKLREENVKAQERLSMLTEIMQGVQSQQEALKQPDQQQGQDDPDADIDPEKDIFGAHAQLRKRYDTLMKSLDEIRQAQTQQSTNQQVTDLFRQDATRFSRENPDFVKSVEYLMEMRRAELEVLGFNDKQAIDNQLAQEQRTMIMKAYRDKTSPSELLYRMAKAKGWKKPEPTPAPAPAPAPAPQPAAQAPSQQQTAAQKVEHLKNGMAANATMSGSGGSPGEGLTVQQLANMSEDDFLNLAAKLGKNKMDALLRG